jgi:tRNA (cmo5U34)-methyltransferase
MTSRTMNDEPRWEDDDSATFIRFADLFVPQRAEQLQALLTLVPAEPDEAFAAIDLGSGPGALSLALLDAFPHCRVTAVDLSPLMLNTLRERAAGHAERLTLIEGDIATDTWADAIQTPVRLVVSSLAIHHLDGPEKQRLYARLGEMLEPGGALLILDIVEPVNARAARAYAEEWDRAVTSAAESAGESDALGVFRDGWNHFATPDLEFDKPSPLRDNLRWLDEAGFVGVDCFRLNAGHALFGGYRP